jgi:hypothetical protein
MRLPRKEPVVVVGFTPIDVVPFRNIPHNASPLEYIEPLKKLTALDRDLIRPRFARTRWRCSSG